MHVVRLMRLSLAACAVAMMATTALAAPRNTARVAVSELVRGGWIVKADAHLAAPPEAVLATLTDFDNYAILNPDIERVQVISRTANTARVRITLESVPLVPTLWYVADYTWREVGDDVRIDFALVMGSFDRNDGYWLMTRTADGTQLDYRGNLDIDLPLAPPQLLRSGIRSAMEDWLAVVKREARKRGPRTAGR